MGIELARSGDGFGRRLSLVYAGVFLVVGVYVPFFPVWLDARGLGATEIGIVLAIPVFAKVVMAPLVANVADRTGRRRAILTLLVFGATLSGIGLHFVSSFAAVLFGVLVLSLFWNPVMPLTEAVAISGARARGLDYGRMRLWGSISFIVANIAGGWLVDRSGADASLFFVIGAFVFTFAVTLGLPAPDNAPDRGDPGPESTGKGEFGWRQLMRPGFLGFLVVAALLQSSHGVYYLFSTLHWKAQGISTTLIGILWATGVIGEILLFIWSGQALLRLGTRGLMFLAIAAAAIRWSALGFAVPVVWLFPVQLLHAFTFGATHLAVINYIGDTVPEHMSSTAQSLNYALIGILLSLVTFAAGPLYGALGGEAYWVMGGLAGLALGVLLSVPRGETIAMRRADQR